MAKKGGTKFLDSCVGTNI